MARRDRWTIDFESVRGITIPWPQPPEYNAGRNEARNLISQANRLVNDYKVRPGNKAPRNGDLAYHMLAFRYGYNSAASTPAKSPADQAFTGGLFADVYESKQMRDSYNSTELRTNKSMIEGGKAFFALVDSQPTESARKETLMGFKEGIDGLQIDIYTMYPRDKRAPEKATPSAVDDDDGDDPFSSSSSSSSATSSSSSSSYYIEPNREVARATVDRRDFDNLFDKIEVTPPSVSGIPFQQDAVRYFTNFQQNVRQQNSSLTPTFFDMFHQGSVEMAEKYRLEISDIVTKIIKMEAVKFFKVAQDGNFALICGYGAGEEHHALLQTTLDRIKNPGSVEGSREGMINVSENIDAIERVAPKIQPVLYQFGFMGAINQFFLSWETNSENAISVRDLYEGNMVTLNYRLKKKFIVDGVIKAVTGRAYSSDTELRADRDYNGFTYFIEAGIASAANFLKRFVERKSGSEKTSNPMTYQLWFSTFGAFFLGWHTYMTTKGMIPTDHVESIKRKMDFVRNIARNLPEYNKDLRFEYEATDLRRMFATKPSPEVSRETLGERNTGMFFARLDPDFNYYAKLNQEEKCTLDLLAAYLKERFGVDPTTGMSPLSGPRYLTVAWQTRVVQMVNITPIAGAMMNGAGVGGIPKYLMNLLTNLESEAGNDYKEFYQNLGEFASTFSNAAYTKLITKNAKNLPAIQVLERGFHNRMRYATIVDQQINKWLVYNKTIFMPTEISDVWNKAQSFWTFDERTVQGGSIISELIASAYTRKMNDERDNFLRKRKFLMEYGTFELPYIEKRYALIVEVLTMAYMLTASLAEDDGEFLSDAHATITSGNDQRKAKAKIEEVMNRFWLRRKTNYVYPWIPVETQNSLAEQLANIEITDEDYRFLNTFSPTSALPRLTLQDIASQIEDTDIFRDLWITVYWVEMYTNCNTFATDFINRDWGKVITFGDLHANQNLFSGALKKSKISHDEAYGDMFTYFMAMQTLNQEKITPTTTDDESVDVEDNGTESEAASSTPPDQDETEEPEEVEEIPALKKFRPPSASSSSPQPSSSFFEPAFSSMRGKWYSLMFEAEQLNPSEVIVGPDRRVYSNGAYLGMNFAQDVAAFVSDRYPQDSTLAERYSNVRAYAINQLSSIYNELEQQKISAAIIDADFNNPVSQRHEVEAVRLLLAITQPVATQIFNFEGKKDVYMLGFVNGYEQKTAEVAASFAMIKAPEGGGRKVAQISAAISRAEGTLADLVSQLEKTASRSLVPADVKAGRSVGNVFVEGVIQYAKQNNLSYQSAVSRAYIDLENYHDKLAGSQSVVLFVQTGAFVKAAARDILQYPNDKVSFIQGFLLAMDRINSMSDNSRVIISYFNDYDEDFNPDAARPDVGDIVAAVLSAQRVDELHLEGVGFSNSEFEAIIRDVRDTATINSISLNGTSVSTIEGAFNAFPNLRGFTSINNPITATEFMTVFELPSTRAHLTSLNVETHLFDKEKLTEFLQVFNTFFENSNVLRDVELEFNLSTRSFAADNKLAISYLYNGLMKSSSIQTFYCQGVYPFRYDTIHQDAISKHLKKNRGSSISSHYPHSSVSPAKAREILHHGSVHGHPLTKAQRGFFGARSRE